MIQSVGLWDIDRQGLPRLRHGWSRAREPLPTPERSWSTVALPARYPEGVVACGMFGGPPADQPTLVIFKCAPAAQSAAAVEVWSLDPTDDVTLQLRDAWYSRPAKPMAQYSRHTRIRLGSGLPGRAAQLRSPAYLGNLGTSGLFVRAYSAMQVHLHHGLALPGIDGRGVLVLLTGDDEPVARRIELSLVRSQGMHRLLGHCQREGPLALHASVPPLADARLRECAVSGQPLLLGAGAGIDGELNQMGADALLALPFSNEAGEATVLSLWL